MQRDKRYVPPLAPATEQLSDLTLHRKAASRYRKNKDHDNPGEAHGFHGFKGAVRIESLNRDTPLSRQKRHEHIPFGILPKG
jgi:hypothetical protein